MWSIYSDWRTSDFKDNYLAKDKKKDTSYQKTHHPYPVSRVPDIQN